MFSITWGPITISKIIISVSKVQVYFIMSMIAITHEFVDFGNSLKYEISNFPTFSNNGTHSCEEEQIFERYTILYSWKKQFAF